MQSLIFLGLLVSYLLALYQRRKYSLILFAVTLLVNVYWFNYHVTESVNINL